MEMADDGDAVMADARAADNAGGHGIKLRTIVINNFKNYVGEHTIEIDGEPFVCFFGRNGAGKSCVVDAIAFSLGATPQQLRVKRFAKLLNDIVAARDPAALASVALCFDAGGQKQVWIRRTVDGASSQSKYQYSDTPTLLWKSGSKTTIEDALHNHGVDMQLQDRFIIRQANASALAQMSSVQLLHFCERIIGTFTIKDQLSDLNKQWEDLSSRSDVLLDETMALDKEAESYQPMVTKYEDWLEKTEKTAAERTCLQKTLASTNQSLVRLYRHDLDRLKAERIGKQHEATQLRVAAEKKEAECTQQSKLIQRHQTQASKATQHLRQLTKTKAGISNQLETLQSERNAVQIRGVHFNREKDELAKTIADLEEQSIADAGRVADLEVQSEEAAKGVAALVKSNSSEARTQKVIQVLVKEIEDTETTIRNATTLQANQAKATADSLQSLERIQRDIAQHLTSQASTKSTLQQLERSINQDCKDMTGLQSEEEQLLITVAKLEADQILHARNTAKSSSRSRGDVIIQRLQESLGENIVRGRLWELALTEAKYSDAVNSALQAQLSHVVVADRSSAIRVSRAFTEEAVGRVSCCILDELDSSLNCSRSACGAGSSDQNFSSIVPLCDAVKCSDVRLRRLLHKYAHNWVIVRDTEEAARVVARGKVNCVTLQGDLFYGDGSIRAFRKARSHEAALTVQIRSVDASAIASFNASRVREPVNSASCPSGTLAESRDKLRRLKTSIDELKERIDADRQTMERLSIQADQCASAVKALQSKEVIVQRELEITQTESSGDLAAQIETYSGRLTALKRSKSKILQSSGSKKRANLLSTQAKCDRELAAIKSHVDMRKVSIAKLRVKEQTLTQQQVTLSKKSENLGKEVQNLENQIASIDKDLQSATRKAEEQTEALSAAKLSLQALASEQRDLEDALRKKRKEVKGLLVDESSTVEKISAVEVELEQFCDDCADFDDSMEDGETSAQNFQDEQLQLRSALDAVEDEQKVLDSIQSTISVEIIERAIQCEDELAKVREQLQQNKARLADLSAQQHHLAIDRHKRLVESLSTVNANFSRIYRLMNEDGDCYLGYSMERSTLFAEGVTLNCKPDESHWQSFLGLSGGQQVICAVSLMLALQASFPNPFYVCDEIDAALDTLNVKKLAELLRDQSHQTNTQFLVVSHRPEMWEVGKFLVGVYECEKSARTISCRFE